MHYGHHRHAGDRQDPDGFHIRGGPIRAFLGALFVAQIVSWTALPEQGLTCELAIAMAIKAGLFTLAAGAAPETFLVFFISLRISYTLNDYVFFHLLHYRHGRVGTYRLAIRLPSPLQSAINALYGKAVLPATLFHGVPHHYPGVAAEHLPAVAKLLDR